MILPKKIVRGVFSKARLLSNLRKKGLKIVLPFAYLLFLVVGLLLYLTHTLFPRLVVCLNIFGGRVCSSIGVLITTVVSLPGYIVVGIILSNFVDKVPVAISLFLVVVISFLIYFAVGFILDKIGRVKIIPKMSLQNLILAIFLILAFLLFILSRNISAL